MKEGDLGWEQRMQRVTSLLVTKFLDKYFSYSYLLLVKVAGSIPALISCVIHLSRKYIYYCFIFRRRRWAKFGKDLDKKLIFHKI